MCVALKEKSMIFHFSLGYIYPEYAELSAILWKNGRRGRSISLCNLGLSDRSHLVTGGLYGVSTVAKLLGAQADITYYAMLTHRQLSHINMPGGGCS